MIRRILAVKLDCPLKALLRRGVVSRLRERHAFLIEISGVFEIRRRRLGLYGLWLLDGRRRCGRGCRFWFSRGITRIGFGLGGCRTLLLRCFRFCRGDGFLILFVFLIRDGIRLGSPLTRRGRLGCCRCLRLCLRSAVQKFLIHEGRSINAHLEPVIAVGRVKFERFEVAPHSLVHALEPQQNHAFPEDRQRILRLCGDNLIESRNRLRVQSRVYLRNSLGENEIGLLGCKSDKHVIIVDTLGIPVEVGEEVYKVENRDAACGVERNRVLVCQNSLVESFGGGKKCALLRIEFGARVERYKFIVDFYGIGGTVKTL